MMIVISQKNGDLVVWGNAPYGHIAIADGDSRSFSFYSYDQNWNGKEMHRQKHNYKDVYGSLRPIDQDKVNGLKFTIETIMNLDLYSKLYADLQNAFHGNKEQLYLHLIQNGVNEHRKFSYVYDPLYYKDKYADLQKLTWWELLDHFNNDGIKENRQAIKIFDVKYYKDHNQDLQFDNLTLVNHFLRYGINEWRETSKDFNVRIYRDSNKDLQKAFGNNCQKYYEHYILYGQAENRKCN